MSEFKFQIISQKFPCLNFKFRRKSISVTTTPPISPRETKRITTPTPYDAMMELTLEEERKNGETSKSHKTYAESVREGLERAVEKKELTKEEAFPTVGINGGKSLITISKLKERVVKDAV